MRKVTRDICNAFMQRNTRNIGNSHTDGTTLYLHGNAIAKWQDGKLYVRDGGYQSNTTKERLNGLQGVQVHQKAFQWYLNGKKWDGEWVDVEKFTQDTHEICTACGFTMKSETEKAVSRYNHGMICTLCGQRESIQGDFIARNIANGTQVGVYVIPE